MTWGVEPTVKIEPDASAELRRFPTQLPCRRHFRMGCLPLPSGSTCISSCGIICSMPERRLNNEPASHCNRLSAIYAGNLRRSDMICITRSVGSICRKLQPGANPSRDISSSMASDLTLNITDNVAVNLSIYPVIRLAPRGPTARRRTLAAILICAARRARSARRCSANCDGRAVCTSVEVRARPPGAL